MAPSYAAATAATSTPKTSTTQPTSQKPNRLELGADAYQAADMKDVVVPGQKHSTYQHQKDTSKDTKVDNRHDGYNKPDTDGFTTVSRSRKSSTNSLSSDEAVTVRGNDPLLPVESTGSSKTSSDKKSRAGPVNKETGQLKNAAPKKAPIKAHENKFAILDEIVMPKRSVAAETGKPSAKRHPGSGKKSPSTSQALKVSVEEHQGQNKFNYKSTPEQSSPHSALKNVAGTPKKGKKAPWLTQAITDPLVEVTQAELVDVEHPSEFKFITLQSLPLIEPATPTVSHEKMAIEPTRSRTTSGETETTATISCRDNESIEPSPPSSPATSVFGQQSLNSVSADASSSPRSITKTGAVGKPDHFLAETSKEPSRTAKKKAKKAARKSKTDKKPPNQPDDAQISEPNSAASHGFGTDHTQSTTTESVSIGTGPGALVKPKCDNGLDSPVEGVEPPVRSIGSTTAISESSNAGTQEAFSSRGVLRPFSSRSNNSSTRKKGSAALPTSLDSVVWSEMSRPARKKLARRIKAQTTGKKTEDSTSNNDGVATDSPSCPSKNARKKAKRRAKEASKKALAEAPATNDEKSQYTKGSSELVNATADAALTPDNGAGSQTETPNTTSMAETSTDIEIADAEKVVKVCGDGAFSPIIEVKNGPGSSNANESSDSGKEQTMSEAARVDSNKSQADTSKSTATQKKQLDYAKLIQRNQTKSPSLVESYSPTWRKNKEIARDSGKATRIRRREAKKNEEKEKPAETDTAKTGKTIEENGSTTVTAQNFNPPPPSIETARTLLSGLQCLQQLINPKDQADIRDDHAFAPAETGFNFAIPMASVDSAVSHEDDKGKAIETTPGTTSETAHESDSASPEVAESQNLESPDDEHHESDTSKAEPCLEAVKHEAVEADFSPSTPSKVNAPYWYNSTVSDFDWSDEELSPELAAKIKTTPESSPIPLKKPVIVITPPNECEATECKLEGDGAKEDNDFNQDTVDKEHPFAFADSHRTCEDQAPGIIESALGNSESQQVADFSETETIEVGADKGELLLPDYDLSEASDQGGDFLTLEPDSEAASTAQNSKFGHHHHTPAGGLANSASLSDPFEKNCHDDDELLLPAYDNTNLKPEDNSLSHFTIAQHQSGEESAPIVSSNIVVYTSNMPSTSLEQFSDPQGNLSHVFPHMYSDVTDKKPSGTDQHNESASVEGNHEAPVENGGSDANVETDHVAADASSVSANLTSGAGTDVEHAESADDRETTEADNTTNEPVDRADNDQRGPENDQNKDHDDGGAAHVNGEAPIESNHVGEALNGDRDGFQASESPHMATFLMPFPVLTPTPQPRAGAPDSLPAPPPSPQQQATTVPPQAQTAAATNQPPVTRPQVQPPANGTSPRLQVNGTPPQPQAGGIPLPMPQPEPRVRALGNGLIQHDGYFYMQIPKEMVQRMYFQLFPAAANGGNTPNPTTNGVNGVNGTTTPASETASSEAETSSQAPSSRNSLEQPDSSRNSLEQPSSSRNAFEEPTSSRNAFEEPASSRNGFEQ